MLWKHQDEHGTPVMPTELVFISLFSQKRFRFLRVALNQNAMNSWLHYQVYGNQVATERSVKLGLLLAKRSRCFCNKVLKPFVVVSELLRLHKAKPFNGHQEPSYLGPPWQDWPRNWVANSASLSPAPPSRLCKRGRRIQWKGKGIFYGEVISVLHISTHPTPSPGKGTDIPSSLGKMRSLSNGSRREPSKVPRDEPAIVPAIVHLPTQKVLISNYNIR